MNEKNEYEQLDNVLADVLVGFNHAFTEQHGEPPEITATCIIVARTMLRMLTVLSSSSVYVAQQIAKEILQGVESREQHARGEANIPGVKAD